MKTNLFGKTACFVLGLFVCSGVFSQASEKPRVNTVLIVKSNSWLENTVSGMVTDSLVKRGYKVTLLDIKHLSGENARDYFMTIVFDGVKSARLIESVSGYSKQAHDRTFNLFVFRITGDLYDADAGVDAFTAATRSVKPVDVADRIVRTVLKAGPRNAPVPAQP